MAPKLIFLDSLSLNAAMYASGTWHSLLKSDLARFQSAHVRRHRSILRMPRFEKGGPTDKAALAAAERPLASSLLRVSRLRLFCQVLHGGPAPLRAIIQEEFRVSKSSWLQEVLGDLDWLRCAHFKYADFSLLSLEPMPRVKEAM
eukprot:4480231-Pyramimonas_sp.AAC.1